MTFVHLDDTGQPCVHHPARPVSDALAALAAIGSRMASFNHDIASKIQGLMMALDEISEIIEVSPDPNLAQAAETAQVALKELNTLLTVNRQLTKPPVKTAITLRELVTKAGMRAGVAVRGTLPDTTVEVAIPFATQAISLAFDAAAGPGRSRVVEVTANGTALSFPISATCGDAFDSFALAGWLLARDNVTLCCSAAGDMLVLRF